MVEQITDKDFKAKAMKGKVIVDFYADWCGPCQMMKPVFEKTSADFKDVHFFKVDVDENQDSAEDNGVRSIPTILFLKDGKEIDRAVGYVAPDAFKEKIKKAFH